MGYNQTADSLTQSGTLSADDFIWNNPDNTFPDPWAFLPPILTASSADLAAGLPSAAPALPEGDPSLTGPTFATSAAAPNFVTEVAASSMLAAPSDANSSSTQPLLDSFGAPVLNTGSSGSAGLVINISTYNALPAGLITAINAAVQFLESEITNNITVNIQIGYGTYWNGRATLGVNDPIAQTHVNAPPITAYSTLRSALISHATSADDQSAIATLGTDDPLQPASNYAITTAEEKALGLLSGTATAIDAWIGINNTASFTYDPNNRSVAGAYDAIGVLEHEMTEALGRISSPATLHTALDLFRYSGADVRSLAVSNTASFSLDGGTTMLQGFDFNGGDPGDWSGALGIDSFNGTATIGSILPVSATDLRVMDVLGYTIACFAAGTRIAAERGEVPVEELQVGEHVYTRFGGLEPIRWIGQRKIDCARHPNPHSAQPIRIAAAAFAPGTPVRPLWLSPEHAVEVDGALIPIRLLLNGGSIAQQHDAARVHYWHIELARHDLLFAEGLAAESYLDTGNRDMFANAPGPVQLHPDMQAAAQAQREAESCLPLLLDPDRLEPVWRALADRSQYLGFAPPEPPETTDDPGLHLIADGRRIDALARAGDRCWFALPESSRHVRLVSRSVIPSALRPWLDDRRRLGVMLHRLTLHTTEGPMPLTLDDPRLTDGWWPPEGDYPTLWRWTDGHATLPPLPDTRMLELRLGAPLAYPITAVPVDHARQAA